MKAHEKITKLQKKLNNYGINIDYFSVYALRLAEMRLHRWCELECGDSNGYASFSIVRDDRTDKPYMETSFNSGRVSRNSIADREKGALKRIEKICKELNLHWFYQTDPRGCALYVSNVPMTDSNYSSIGYAVCDDAN